MRNANTKPLIAANWKMHGNQAQVQAWVPEVRAKLQALTGKVEAALCPPALFLQGIAAQGCTPLTLGGQDCHSAPHGAYTGDISAAMLKEAGCSYVIVGHSERRQTYGETDALVRAKALAAIEAGLVPIICVGETLVQREAGQAETVVEAQIEGSILTGKGDYVVAYEPVWAIGTGKTPTSEDIAAMHRHIAALVGQGVRILYGGSVKGSNAKDILAIPHVGGALVGGASLQAPEFCAILDSAPDSLHK